MNSLRTVARQGAAAVLLIASGLVSGLVVAKEVPYLAGRVNDLASLLSPSTAAAIETQLAELEESTGAQIAVLTVPSLEGEVLEDYSLRVAETWKLGRGEFDDGALLLIARDERQMRLEVGYGLEGTIPDAYAKRILDDVLRPRFRAGDFDGGVSDAVEVVSALVRGEEALPPPSVDSTRQLGDLDWSQAIAFVAFLIPVGIFSLRAITAQGCVAWFLYLFLMPFWLAFPLAILGRPLGFFPVGLWVIGFPVLWAILRGSGTGSRWQGPGPFFGTGGGWSSSRGGWGGGFSGGGFSGGGGSFGGGGASGSW